MVSCPITLREELAFQPQEKCLFHYARPSIGRHLSCLWIEAEELDATVKVGGHPEVDVHRRTGREAVWAYFTWHVGGLEC